jgi:hypothetical protein
MNADMSWNTPVKTSHSVPTQRQQTPVVGDGRLRSIDLATRSISLAMAICFIPLRARSVIAMFVYCGHATPSS